MICFDGTTSVCKFAFWVFQREKDTRSDEKHKRWRAKLILGRKCLAMFGCFIVVRLICLSVCLSFSRGFTFDRTIYNRVLRSRQGAKTYRNNALYPGTLRGNNFWPRKINAMALSYTRTRQRWINGRRVRFGNVN